MSRVKAMLIIPLLHEQPKVLHSEQYENPLVEVIDNSQCVKTINFQLRKDLCMSSSSMERIQIMYDGGADAAVDLPA